jgi:hypothetical protein
MSLSVAIKEHLTWPGSCSSCSFRSLALVKNAAHASRMSRSVELEYFLFLLTVSVGKCTQHFKSESKKKGEWLSIAYSDYVSPLGTIQHHWFLAFPLPVLHYNTLETIHHPTELIIWAFVYFAQGQSANRQQWLSLEPLQVERLAYSELSYHGTLVITIINQISKFPNCIFHDKYIFHQRNVKTGYSSTWT